MPKALSDNSLALKWLKRVSVLHLEGRGLSPLTASICFAEVSLSKILSVSATDPIVSVEEGDWGDHSKEGNMGN